MRIKIKPNGMQQQQLSIAIRAANPLEKRNGTSDTHRSLGEVILFAAG